jgi:2-polyprenyl-3-methyl-5-hydroxy-6-metoxy-1,4-benzoquinol methylase
MPQKINCPICRSEATKFKLEINSYKYYRCLNCGITFLENKYNFKNLKEIYNKNYFEKQYKPDSDFNYFIDNDEKINEKVNLNKVTVNKFKEYSMGNNTVLEIGCAAGYFLEAIKREGNNNVYGLEISKEAAEFAKNKFNINIIGDNIDSVGEKYNNFFDSIFMFHVLEHLKDPILSLEKIYRFLKPGGILIIEVPNAKSFDVIASSRIRKEVFHAPYHLFAFNSNNIEKIIEKQGFKILEKNIYFSTVLLRMIVKIRKYFNQKEKHLTLSGTNRIEGKKKRSETIIKKIAKIFFPGSNMKIICKK